MCDKLAGNGGEVYAMSAAMLGAASAGQECSTRVPTTTFTGSSGELILHLGELVPLVRDRLMIGADLSDEAIFSSLAAITSRTSARERWNVAFGSALGSSLASRGSDLNTALNVLMALVPKPRS